MILLKDVILNDESFVEMEKGIVSIQDELIKKAMLDFEQKRIDIINEGLSILGIDICVEDQLRKRFKDFISERIGNETTIWYRDGSETGLRVVTFVDVDVYKFPSLVDNGSRTFEITQRYKYF